MKQYTLYDYQKDILARLHEAFESHTAVMCQMPTGTGKTVVLSAFIKALPKEDVVWIVAHRRELVEQAVATLERFGLTGVRNNGRTDGRRKTVRVLSIQWLSRHWKDMPERPAVIIIDEAHHSLADTYKEMWLRYPEAKKLGMTATPCRLNGASFTELYSSLVTSWSVAEFIEQGYLAPFSFFTIKATSEDSRLIHSLSKRGADGDYQVKEMAELLNRRPNIMRLYQSVEQYAKGKKGIVYAINIRHAHDIANYYNGHGLRTVAIDCKTPTKERERLNADFKAGRLDAIVNVDVYSEGYDCPDVEYIQLARPTLSLAKYLQMVGRGLRVAEGKKACVILDNVGLYSRFRLPTNSINWRSLFKGERFVPMIINKNGRSNSSVRTQPEQDFGLTQVASYETFLPRQKTIQQADENAWTIRKHGNSDCFDVLSGGNVISNEPIYRVVKTTSSYAIGRDERNTYFVLRKNGTWRLLYHDEYDSVTFIDNDFLHFYSKTKGDRFADLKSGLIFNKQPQVIQTAGFEYLKFQDGDCYARTLSKMKWNETNSPATFTDKGFYTIVQVKEIPEGNRKALKKGCTWTTERTDTSTPATNRYVILHNAPSMLYHLVEAVDKDNVVVYRRFDVNYDVEYKAQTYWHVTRNGNLCEIQARHEDIRQRAIVYEYLQRLHELLGIKRKPSGLDMTAEAMSLLHMRQKNKKLIRPFLNQGLWGLGYGDKISVRARFNIIRPLTEGYYLAEDNSLQCILRWDGEIVSDYYTKIEFLDDFHAKAFNAQESKVIVFF